MCVANYFGKFSFREEFDFDNGAGISAFEQSTQDSNVVSVVEINQVTGHFEMQVIPPLLHYHKCYLERPSLASCHKGLLHIILCVYKKEWNWLKALVN